MAVHGMDDQDRWHIKVLQPRLPWDNRAILPADVGNELCNVMLTRENLLEDVAYQKVVPNRYVVELNGENYARNYQPLEKRILQQWHTKLVECLATANSRLGRKEYILSGKVVIEIRPAADLKNNQARIFSQVQPDKSEFPSPANAREGALAAERVPRSGPTAPPVEAQPFVRPLSACLEMLPSGRRWAIYPGMMTIGRLDNCDIFLDSPEVQERRLISGIHAFLHCDADHIRLYDGAPNGRPSLNGTYVNKQRIYATGYELRDGDVIILAAVNPNDPRADTPGVVSFRFRANC